MEGERRGIFDQGQNCAPTGAIILLDPWIVSSWIDYAAIFERFVDYRVCRWLLKIPMEYQSDRYPVYNKDDWFRIRTKRESVEQKA